MTASKSPGLPTRRPPVPSHLYKYRSLTGEAAAYTRDIIISSRLWFSAAADFNDPFDSFPHFSLESSDDAWAAYLALLADQTSNLSTAERLDLLDAMRRQPKDVLIAEMQKAESAHARYLAICCLSAANDQVLMWSHYAGAHSGICLRFATRRGGREIPDPAYPVRYSSERPVVNRAAAPHDTDAVFDAMLVKADFWAYEQEHRLFRPNALSGAGHENFAPGRLDGVIFGARCSQANQERVRGWLHESGRDIALYQAMPDARQFRLEISRLPG